MKPKYDPANKTRCQKNYCGEVNHELRAQTYNFRFQIQELLVQIHDLLDQKREQGG